LEATPEKAEAFRETARPSRRLKNLKDRKTISTIPVRGCDC
jgi:hypothetical protein